MTSEATAEVEALLQQWLAAAQAGDVEALVSLAIGDDIALVGTGADEVRFGLTGFREQVERDIGQAEDIVMSYDNLRVASYGDAAFAYCAFSVSGSAGGQRFEMPGLRCTFGLVRTPQGWRFAQMHTSAPASGQPGGRSYY